MTAGAWIVWAIAISAGMISARVSTVMARGGIEQAGGLAALQSLNFVAVVVLVAVPFFGLNWYVALAVSIIGSFLNPPMLIFASSKLVALYRALPALNLLSIAGAAYLAWRSISVISRGYGQL